MKKEKDVFIKNTGNIIICVDFGHNDDIAVESVFRKDKNRLTLLSQKVIGRACDFVTEEKREKYLNNE